MKAYIGIKYHHDFRNKRTIDIISNILQNNNFESVCIVRDFEKYGNVILSPQELMMISFKQIASCDLIIIETTEKGIGIGIEAGYSYAKNIPILTLVKKGSAVSVTLKGISWKIIVYDGEDSLKTFLGNSLREIRRT